jgi:hypothetical protein
LLLIVFLGETHAALTLSSTARVLAALAAQERLSSSYHGASNGMATTLSFLRLPPPSLGAGHVTNLIMRTFSRQMISGIVFSDDQVLGCASSSESPRYAKHGAVLPGMILLKNDRYVE